MPAFFCLFVVMFNDAARFLEYTASNNWDDREYEIGKDSEGRVRGLLKVTQPIFVSRA